MGKGKRPRMGRPPRTDNPVRVGFRLPGAVYGWLRRRARTEARPQSEVLTDALVQYRQRAARRRRKP